MKRFAGMLVLMLFIPVVGFGQSTYSGFMGKRSLLQLSISPWIPILQSTLDENYVEKNGSLVRKKCLFMMDTRLSVSFYKKRNFGFGLEAGAGFFSFAPIYNFYEGGDVFLRGKAELIRASVIQIMPKLELSSSQGLLPVGIAHTIGLGINFYEIKNKTYLYEADEKWGYSSAYVSDHYYNFDNRKFKGFTLLYGVMMRLPLTERLLLNYSLSYAVNIALLTGETSNDGNEYFVSRGRMLETLRANHAFQFIKTGIGISYTF